jgi:hypothetical protein
MSRFYRQYLNSFAWKNFRAQVIANCGGRCQRCRDLTMLEVHHLHYRTLGQECLP